MFFYALLLLYLFYGIIKKTAGRGENMNNLQSIRKKRGLSQRQLSLASGVSFRTIQHYERDEYNFDHVYTHTMLRLALALGCPLSDLLSGDSAETARQYEKMMTCCHL